MSAMALFAAQRGIETGFAIKGAFDSQAQAAQQSFNMSLQMEEIETRTKMQIQNIYQQSDKVVAHQQAAFISGGVTLSGSAMSVISDTLNNAAEAAYIRQRESDYDLLGIAMEKQKYDSMASNETLMLNIAAAGLGGASAFAGDMYKNQQANTKNRGASGIGGGGPDRAGGTTSYSSDYLGN